MAASVDKWTFSAVTPDRLYYKACLIRPHLGRRYSHLYKAAGNSSFIFYYSDKENGCKFSEREWGVRVRFNKKAHIYTAKSLACRCVIRCILENGNGTHLLSIPANSPVVHVWILIWIHTFILAFSQKRITSPRLNLSFRLCRLMEQRFDHVFVNNSRRTCCEEIIPSHRMRRMCVVCVCVCVCCVSNIPTMHFCTRAFGVDLSRFDIRI